VTQQLAIRDYAQLLSKLSTAQIQEVLEEILDTREMDERTRPVVLAFNARLMTALRERQAWPRR
jgi:DNA-directed RNA polymerase subunit F